MAPTKLAFLLLEKDEERDEKMAGVTRLELATSTRYQICPSLNSNSWFGQSLAPKPQNR